MALRMAELNGNPYIGVFCRLIGDTVLVPLEADEPFMKDFEEVLNVKVVNTTIGGTTLHGSLIAANSKGVIMPYFCPPEELSAALRKADIPSVDEGLNIAASDDPVTAWGNNLLLSEKVALVNPDISHRSMKLIEDIMDVEPVPGTIAGVRTVGSVAALNSKGMVVHPKASLHEIERLRELFKVDVQISTANFGSPYLGASMVVNDRGGVVGSRSSGVELNRIEMTLDLID